MTTSSLHPQAIPENHHRRRRCRDAREIHAASLRRRGATRVARANSVLGGQADALGAAHARRGRPRQVRSRSSGSITSSARSSDAVCLSARRLRGVLSDARFPSTIAAQWLGDRDVLRRTRRGLPEARHGRHRAHRSARDVRRRAGRAPGLDRRGRRAADRAGIGRRRRCG